MVDDASPPPPAPSPPSEGANAKLFALTFALFAVICVLIGSYYVKAQIIDHDFIKPIMQNPGQNERVELVTIIVLFQAYFPLILIALFSFFFVRTSIFFVKSSEYSRSGVVSPRDLPIIQEAIKNGKPDPIDQYIRLASLTGGVGLFQKVGLTGLPLVTLGLVVFFALGIVVFDDKSETFKAFLDLEKLILGAFIGSFVQRQVERRGQETDIQRAIQTVATDSAARSK